MTRLEIHKAISTLHTYQKWRRGAKIDMIPPKEVGIAIDTAIHYLRFCAALDTVITFCHKVFKKKSSTYERIRFYKKYRGQRNP